MRTNRIGRYELLDELSRGGMGVVYRARDPLIDRVVAIKTIGMGLSRLESQAFDERFDREARSAGRLNHPNIVTIHDMGKSDDGAYIAMEFLEGKSLRDILDTGIVLEPARVAHVVAQVADGLAFAHERGVVHCDIKPANVMVLPSGLVKITDFGIARLPAGSRTFSGAVVGSPRYISPEQILGRPVDARSDVFALGAVLYEMLTGVPPFGGGELDEILFQVINDKPEPPSSRNAAIPKAFDAIVDRALAKSPADRYASAAQIAADLRRAAAGEGAATLAPLPAPQRTKRRRARGTATTVLIDGPGGHAPLRVVAQPPWRRRLFAYGVPALAFALGAGWIVVDGRSATDNEAANAVAPVMPLPASAALEAPRALASDPQPLVATPTTAAEPAPVAKPRIARPVASVAIAVTPWGEVFVDGTKRGVSPPLTELRLAPGRHTIELRNSTFAPHAETIDVLADANLRIKHKFE